MSGHSKWSKIKHKKAATDAKRANVFTKLAKDVTIAAKEGGGDPEMNFRLRMAMDKAKAANMPKSNIERAIKRGTGELKDGVQIEEVIYEAYGPGQIAMLIKTATDNKNRTLSEVKDILNKNGGKFVEGGGVSWQFEQVGLIEVKVKKDSGPTSLQSTGASKGSLFVAPTSTSETNKEDELEMKIIESGAKDYKKTDEGYEVFTLPGELQKVKKKLEKRDSPTSLQSTGATKGSSFVPPTDTSETNEEKESGVKVAGAELVYLAKEHVSVDERTKMDYEKLLEALDESEDVVEVWDNVS